jgi:hypothetical protein
VDHGRSKPYIHALHNDGSKTIEDYEDLGMILIIIRSREGKNWGLLYAIP